MTKQLGKFLRKTRHEKKLTITELKEQSGVSIAQISRIETGRRKSPKPETIRKLSKGLEVDYESLMKAAGYLDMGEGRENEQTSNHQPQRSTGADDGSIG